MPCSKILLSHQRLKKQTLHKIHWRTCNCWCANVIKTMPNKTITKFIYRGQHKDGLLTHWKWSMLRRKNSGLWYKDVFFILHKAWEKGDTEYSNIPFFFQANSTNYLLYRLPSILDCPTYFKQPAGRAEYNLMIVMKCSMCSLSINDNLKEKQMEFCMTVRVVKALLFLDMSNHSSNRIIKAFNDCKAF